MPVVGPNCLVIFGKCVEIEYFIHEISILVQIFFRFYEMFIGLLRLMGIQVIIAVEQFIEQVYIGKSRF